MTARTLTKSTKPGSLLWYWRRTTGEVFQTWLASAESHECYRVESASGTWHLQCHPGNTSEEELRNLNAFFLAMEASEYHVSSRYVRNDYGQLGSRYLDECWTISRISSRAVSNSPWMGSTLTSKQIDSAAEVLAHIHAYGRAYLNTNASKIMQSSSPGAVRLLSRFRRIFPKIYGSEGQPTGLEASRKHPLMLFRALVPADRGQMQGVNVINNTDEPLPDSAFHAERLMEADIAWQLDHYNGPLLYEYLMARLHHVLSELRKEESALGYPRTILHGNYASENLMFDDARIEKIIGWQGFLVGSPLADLARTAVLLMTDWTKASRPHEYRAPAVVDRDNLQRFYDRYQAAMKKLCGGLVMSSSFGQAIESVTLLTNYMKLACYAILVEQLESEAIVGSAAEQRCRVITQVLHVERLLWQ